MGIFNCESTIKEAIESLLSQSYKAFQIILCDDGSTDNTYNIAKEYANKYSNIILYSQTVVSINPLQKIKRQSSSKMEVVLQTLDFEALCGDA